MESHITILYGTMTGNARDCAEETAKLLQAAGFTARVLNASDYAPEQLGLESTLLLVVSTWGDGEPPDEAVDLFEYVKQQEPGSLPNLKFSILALGDTNYDLFCKCGKDFDEMLAACGAARIAPRADCDVDFYEAAEHWRESILEALQGKESLA